MNKTLVVVPTYNERENLPPLAQRLLALPVPVDLLVVDDNSPDGTGKLANELAAEFPSVHVLHRTETATPQALTFLAMELALDAEKRAQRVTSERRGSGER